VQGDDRAGAGGEQDAARDLARAGARMVERGDDRAARCRE
jgi:hypothetical protein